MKKPSLKKLTKKEKDALRAIVGGADIASHELAGTLRGIQARHPHLITITKVQGDYDGVGIDPYFGAMPTVAGLAAIKT